MRQIRTMRHIGTFCLIGIVGLAPGFALATDYSSTNFKVNNPVIEELGGFSTSATFRLWSNIPFIEPVRATSTSYNSIPGFLGYTGVATTSVTSSSSSGGGGGGIAGETEKPIKPGEPKPKPEVSEVIRKRVDFNKDGRVDFIDFSILLYYFDKTGSIIIPFDLNDDGIVDIIDISIFMYYWDGS